MNRRRLKILLLIGAIAAPIVVYICVFGFELSLDHSRWAEFGSAIGGIYSPLIAILTLVVVMKQVLLQREINTHEYDEAYLQQARHDVEFYCIKLAEIMDSNTLTDKSLRTILHECFEPPTVQELDSIKLHELAVRIHSAVPAVFDIWSAIYPIFAGLETNKKPMFELTYTASRQKLIALLSFESCVALDNFHRSRCQGQAKLSYIFSRIACQ